MNEVRVVHPNERDASTAQTPGMQRVAGVSTKTCESSGVWMAEVTAEPHSRSGAHHHGDLETAIYVQSGRIRMRWGERLEHSVDGGPGDFLFVPSTLIHQEMNVSDQRLVVILARNGQETVVPVEMPPEILAAE